MFLLRWWRRAAQLGGRLPWGIVALEVFSVTLSVLAALAISDWQRARAERRSTREAVAGILVEVRANRAQVERRVGYYREMAGALRGLADRGVRRIEHHEELPAGWRGLAPPLLTAAAYDTAIAMQTFSHLDFEVARGIAFVYSFQRLYMSVWEQRLMGRSGLDSVPQLAADLEDFAGTSDELVRALAQLEERLEGFAGP